MDVQVSAPVSWPFNPTATNPAAVADYRAGKQGAINFLKGQVMKATKGKANPAVAEELLRKHLDS